MASRPCLGVWAEMAKRPEFQEQRAVLRAPETQRFQGTEAWINTAIQINNSVNDYLDRQAASEATERGAKDGLERDEEGKLSFHTVDNTTIRGRAYNQAGLQSYQASLDSQVKQRLAEINRTHKDDPSALKSQMESYAKGVKSDVLKQAPVVAGSVNARIESSVAAYMDASLNAAQKRVVENAAVEVTASVDSLTNDAITSIRNGVNRDQVLRTITSNRAVLHRTLLANGPKGGFTTDKSTHIDPALRKEFNTDNPNIERTGVFTAKEIQAAMKAYDEKAAEEQYAWGIRQAIKLDRGIQYLENFRKDTSGILTPERQDAIEKRLFTEIAEQNKIDSALEAQEKEIQDRIYIKTESSLTTNLLDGTLQKSDVQRELAAGNIKPEKARTLVNAIADVDVDDQNELLEITIRGVENMTEEEIATNPKLSLKTRRSLIEDRQGIVDDLENWRNSQAASEATQRIDREFGIVAGSIQSLDPEEAKKAGKLKTMWYNEVEKLPVEERADKALEIAERVMKHRVIIDAQATIDSQREKLESLEFTSSEAVDAAADRGNEQFKTVFGGRNEGAIQAYKDMINAKLRRIEKQERIIKEAENAIRR